MGYMPIFANVQGKKILVVGGGKVAFRKASRFIRYGAEVTVIAPDICEDLEKLEEIKLIKRRVAPQDIKKDYIFVLTATNDSCLNREIGFLCKTMDIPINRSDDYSEGDLITGSVVEAGGIYVSVFSSGVPEMSKFVSKKIEETLDKPVRELHEVLKSLRGKINSSERKKKIYERFVSDVALDMIKEQGAEELKEEILKCL